MYGFKINMCSTPHSHDWNECPFAHKGEKARRRDPREYNYAAISCPAFRKGDSPTGDLCPFAHGVFEYWLHPAKYRTQACNSGYSCGRRVCFFAHSPEELREETTYQLVYPVPTINGATTTAVGVPAMPLFPVSLGTCWGSGGSSDFLASFSGLTINQGDEMEMSVFGWNALPPLVASQGEEEVESNVMDIDWIMEMIE
ncbi:hypothetical protein CsSME_00001317 [Camellia sinensis var. sinensis]